MDTRSLTGNRDRAKGWTVDASGNWTPSLHDRRRLAVSMLNRFAEETGTDVMPGPIVITVFSRFAVDLDDHSALLKNFDKWLARNFGE